MYNLDVNAAKAADVVGNGGSRITTSGEYVGKIKAAWEETKPSGSKFVNINFVADNGDYINGLSFCVVGTNGTSLDKNGKYIPGFRILNAIMTCTEVRGITESYGEVEVYDYQQGEVVKKQAKLLTELVGKDIGFLLQQEEYNDKEGYLRTDDNGIPKTKIEINTVFEAGTGRTSTEKLGRKARAEDKAKRLAYLEKNPIRKVRNPKLRDQGGIAPLYSGGSVEFGQQQGYGAPAPSAYDDDEIPF